MNHTAEQTTIQELQRRKDQLANYLQTVIKPNDDRLQAFIDNLRTSACNQQTRYKAD